MREGKRAPRVAVAVCAAVLALLAPSPAGAQATPDSVRHRNDCRLARQVLVHGRPADRRTWALEIVVSCGRAGGEALATELRRHRSVPSPELLEPVVWSAVRLRDHAVYEAALGLAADPGASPPARVQAIRILSAQLAPGPGGVSFGYEHYAQMERTDGVVSVGPAVASSDDPTFSGEALPGDALDRAGRVMQLIRASPATPRAVANASAVLLDEIGGDHPCPDLSEDACAPVQEPVTDG